MSYGINFNLPISYVSSSFRRFKPEEHHINRTSDKDVLIIMLKGVLRFSEDGQEKEINAGEYYIQKANKYQRGDLVSDCPEYYYIHMNAAWDNENECLPIQGYVNIHEIYPLLLRLDRTQYNRSNLVEQTVAFFDILLELMKAGTDKNTETVNAMLDDLVADIGNPPSITNLAKKYNFSKDGGIMLMRKF
jgi:hypothetical protein